MFCSDSVFVGILRDITHVTASPVNYRVSPWGVLTSHLFTSVMNTMPTNTDKKMFAYGGFLDFKKAFDTVNHTIWLDKQHHHGIRGILHEWFSSYFAPERKYQISTMAISQPRVTGVPEGSVLRLYFSWFILMTFISLAISRLLYICCRHKPAIWW